MRISRRYFILAGLASVPTYCLAHMRFFAPHWNEITEKTIHTGKLVSPIRILHLSDLHASASVSLESIEKAIDLALEQNADLALLTGDYITDKLENASAYSKILAKLSSAIPTYACIGNHDGGKWAGTTYGYPTFEKVQNLLEQSGIHFLFNQSQEFSVKGNPIKVVGLGDYWSGDTKPETVLERTETDNKPVLVLCHNPDAKELLKPYHWDITFCGHTHGGQLVIPFLGLRPFLPVKDKTFAEGLLPFDGRHIHITRGVGNLHGMRFNCRPEISILNLIPTKI